MTQIFRFLLAALTLVGIYSCGSSADETTSPPASPEVLRDRAMDYWPAERVRHPSAWEEKQKAVARALFAGKHFDVLVVPFQVVDFGFSRAMRSLMSAKLVYALSEAGEDAPDSYLVADVLGDGRREFQRSEVFALARSVGASRVVQGYVGHDQHGVMRIIMRVTRRSDTDAAMYIDDAGKNAVLAGLSITHEHPAIEVFDSALPRLVALLSAAPKEPRRLVDSPHVGDFPAAPLPGPDRTPDPAREAVHLQLLGTLTPLSADRTREKLFEKSLLAVDHMSPTSADYRALKARAFMHLDLRPAALALLEQPHGNAELELVAALDGNLVDIDALLPNIKSSPDRLFALTDLNELRHAYGLFDAAVAASDADSLVIPDSWRYLVSRRFAEWDSWRSPDYEAVKTELDTIFPVAGFSLAEIERGAMALGSAQASDFAVEFSVNRHVTRLREQTPALFCCKPLTYQASPRDLLDILDAAGVANLYDQAEHLIFVQGLPKRALAFLDAADRVYLGHPDLTLARAEALGALSKTAEPESAATLRKQVIDLTADVVLWEQGQTVTAGAALEECWDMYGVDIPNLFTWDLPYRDGYTLERRTINNEIQDDIMTFEQQAELTLLYTRHDFYAFKYLMGLLREANKDDEADRLMQVLDVRFKGAPDRYEWLAANGTVAGNYDAAAQQLRDGIAAHPDDWKLYSLLGASLLEQGANDEAAALYASYAPFKNLSLPPVQLSNEAAEAGGLFYWRGDLVHARPLLELSAGLNTGSEAGFVSRSYLALMQHDYVGAAAASLDRANRYDSPQGYRDYLALLHMLGHSAEASQAFELLVQQQDALYIWDAAYVGHRLSRTSDPDIVAWAKQDHIRTVGGYGKYALSYLVRVGIVDRSPSSDLIGGIAELEGRYAIPKQFYEGARSNTYWLGGAIKSAQPADAAQGLGPTIDVKGPLLSLAEAFRALNANDFGQAFQLFDDAARYHQAASRTSFMKPYYAFAAMKVGKGDEVAAQFAPQDQWASSFDNLLTHAVFAALKGDEKSAVRDLEHARNVRPSEWRPMFTAYEFADVCERLWKETKVPAYRNLAVDWARKYEVLQPWSAWAYVIEAELATDAVSREKALKYAVFLDPGSPRLASIAAPGAPTVGNPFDRSTARSNQASL